MGAPNFLRFGVWSYTCSQRSDFEGDRSVSNAIYASHFFPKLTGSPKLQAVSTAGICWHNTGGATDGMRHGCEFARLCGGLQQSTAVTQRNPTVSARLSWAHAFLDPTDLHAVAPFASLVWPLPLMHGRTHVGCSVGRLSRFSQKHPLSVPNDGQMTSVRTSLVLPALDTALPASAIMPERVQPIRP